MCIYFILWKIRSINKNKKRSHIRKHSLFSLTKMFEQLKFIEILLEIYMYQSTYQRQMIYTLFCLHNTVLISHKGIPGKIWFISFIAKCLILRLIKIIISFWMAEWRWWYFPQLVSFSLILVTTKALLIICWGFHHDNVNQGITILFIKKYIKAINSAKKLN